MASTQIPADEKASEDSFLRALDERRAGGVIDSAFTRIRRPAAFLLLLLALAAIGFALFTGGDRQIGQPQAVGPIDRIAPQQGSFDVIVTVPTEPQPLRATTIWVLDDQSVALFSSEAGEATANVASADTGAIVGLRSEADLLVALAMLPPGLPRPPTELLVSPTSTVLALGALHPDLTTSDLDTYLARLIAVVRSATFPKVAELVDGRTALTDLDSEAGRLIDAMVAESTAAPDVQPTCANYQQLQPTVVRCPDATLQNLGARWAIVVDENDRLCAAIPPATQRASDAEIAEFTRVISAGGRFDTSIEPSSEVSPGSLEASDACGGPASSVATPRQRVEPRGATGAYEVLAEVAAPMAWFLGGSGFDRAQFVFLEDALVDQLADQAEALDLTQIDDRLGLTSRFLTSTPFAFHLGVQPLAPGSEIALDELVTLLMGLYS